jgi:hypothetical protein
VAWPASQACLPSAAVLVLELELMMMFYNFNAGHYLLLLLASVQDSVKNFLAEFVGFT